MSCKRVEADRLYPCDFDVAVQLAKDGGQLSFLNGPRMAARLLGAVGKSGPDFLQAQRAIYERRHLLDPDQVGAYLKESGVEIAGWRSDGDQETLFLGGGGKSVGKEPPFSTGSCPNYSPSAGGGTVASSPVRPSHLPPVSERFPRVLNIGSGARAENKLHAVNVDISSAGKPDVICDVQRLPFRDRSFSLVRASHVLEHFRPSEVLDTIGEWLRVLYRGGELHVVVPDAETTLRELADGVTPKGEASFGIKTTTAPLAQVYGVGYDNPRTDRRWRHHLLFSRQLLKWFLSQAGFGIVEEYDQEEDLAAVCGVDDDSQNHYSLCMKSREGPVPHVVFPPPDLPTYLKRRADFLERREGRDLPPLSLIVPIKDEAANLPPFLESLERALDGFAIPTPKEIIFVLNDCRDDSENLIDQFIGKCGRAEAVKAFSPPGILQAFSAGVEARGLSGYICKMDADTLLHPFSLGLMYIHLNENAGLMATYAEPVPVDGAASFVNFGEHHPQWRSRRLYLHGRLSLYRENPFDVFRSARPLESGMRVEDIFFSYAYALYYGLQSMEATPGAVVYSKPVGSLRDLYRQITRTKKEIRQVETTYPQLGLLRDVLTRRPLVPDGLGECSLGEIITGLGYVAAVRLCDVIADAFMSVNDGNYEWERLSSTKL